MSMPKTMDAIKGHLTLSVWKPVASDKTWGPIQLGDGLYWRGYTHLCQQ